MCATTPAATMPLCPRRGAARLGVDCGDHRSGGCYLIPSTKQRAGRCRACRGNARGGGSRATRNQLCHRTHLHPMNPTPNASDSVRVELEGATEQNKTPGEQSLPGVFIPEIALLQSDCQMERNVPYGTSLPWIGTQPLGSGYLVRDTAWLPFCETKRSLSAPEP